MLSHKLKISCKTILLLQLSLRQNPRCSQPMFKSRLESLFSRKMFQKRSKEMSLVLISWTLPDVAVALRDLQSNPPSTFKSNSGQLIPLWRGLYAPQGPLKTPKPKENIPKMQCPVSNSATVASLPDLDHTHGLARSPFPSVSLSYLSQHISQVDSCDHNLVLTNCAHFLPAASSTWRSKPWIAYSSLLWNASFLGVNDILHIWDNFHSILYFNLQSRISKKAKLTKASL